MTPQKDPNVDLETVAGFGEEWSAFTQEALSPAEHRKMFAEYFEMFPLHALEQAEGFDLGCGSGRWAALVAPHVAKLHCIDPANKALEVSRRRLCGMANVEFHLAGAHDMPLRDESQDFGYSLGVLHHIPDTELALRRCVAKLRCGAPFLVYLYYRFDNRPGWYRALWQASEFGRNLISRLPFGAKRAAAEIIAASVYFPLARAARLAEKSGANVSGWPLNHYRNYGYYTMRTDALDRFGTRLEQRFSRPEIEAMMHRSGLENIQFRDAPPYWIAIGWKAGR